MSSNDKAERKAAKLLSKEKRIHNEADIEGIFRELKTIPSDEVLCEKKKRNPDPNPDPDPNPVKKLRTENTAVFSSDIESLLEQTSADFRKEHQITISGFLGKIPNPIVNFDLSPFCGPIRRALDAAQFTAPTATQAQSWPIALLGRDIITVAKTGSGKTVAFLLPAFHRLLSNASRKRGPPGILVLAPTRELACQIEEECVKFGRSSNIRSACCYGGSPKSMQIRKLQAGIEVLIATPGRLNDLIEMRVVNLSEVLFLVLDEADRMLDMGFEPQIRTIIAKVPVERQSMMFTATWPREIQNLAREFLRDPVEIKFGDTNFLNANKAIDQRIIVISESEKVETLQKVIVELNPEGIPDNIPKCIIFVSRKHECDKLANELWNSGYSVDSLHGDRQQFERTKGKSVLTHI